MGLFDIFKKKTNNTQEIVPVQKTAIQTKTNMIAVRPDTVSKDVLQLLWFSDGPYKNYVQSVKHKSSINMDGIKIDISFMGSMEPSAISMNLPIKQPRSVDDIERPSYYPAYNSISPEQRWIYLNWLRNVESSINIGYVFIFYYGLERHLFFGNVEEAFNMVLRLRKYHKNSSFLGYSSNALIAACLFHKREDLFVKFINSIEDIEEVVLSNIYILVKQCMGMGLTALELMALAGKVGFSNKRYIKDESNLFEIELKKLLQEKLGTENLPLEKYSPKKCPIVQQMIIANYSLDSNQRVIKVPSIIDNQAFSDTVLELLQATHENVKLTLKDLRKSGEYKQQVQTVKNTATKEPDEVFKKSVLFDAIDVHVFDENIKQYNDGICPYCKKSLVKRPAQKGKCSECGNTILVKNSIFTGEKMIITDIENEKLTGIRNEKAQRNWVKTIISYENLNDNDVAKIVKSRNISIEEALLFCINEQASRHFRDSNIGLYRNSLMHTGNIYEHMEQLDNALDMYLTVCFYDLQGCTNGSIEFNKERSFVAPAVCSWILSIGEQLGIPEERMHERYHSTICKMRQRVTDTVIEQSWNELRKALYEQISMK